MADGVISAEKLVVRAGLGKSATGLGRVCRSSGKVGDSQGFHNPAR